MGQRGRRRGGAPCHRPLARTATPDSVLCALWGFESSGAADFAKTGPSGARALGVVVDAAGDLVVAGTNVPAGLSPSGFVARYIGFGAPASGTSPCGGTVPPPPPPPPRSLVVSTKGTNRFYRTATVAKHGLKVPGRLQSGVHDSRGACGGKCPNRQAGLHIKTRFKRCTKSHGHVHCRKLRGYRALTLSPRNATLKEAGTKTFVLRLARFFTNALEKQRSVGATLRVSATSPVTHKGTTIRKSVTFRR